MRFFLNTNFILDHGASLKISHFIKEYVGYFSKPALIYDEVLENQSYFNKVLDTLKKSFPQIYIKINDKKGEPTYQYLNSLSNYFRSKDIDIVIAVGGGSTMDLGKGVSFLLANTGDALTYKGFPKNVNDPIPLVTCPSLFGSGADVSYNAVFIDEDEGKKLGINSTKNFPNLAVIDSKLTMEAPESAIISSAMDTLVHCVDSFGSVKHTPMSRMYSVRGFNHTFKVLLNNSHMKLEYRDSLALGSVCGITALMNSSDGPTNGFAYYLGVKYNVPHGLAGAIFLKEVMKYNVQHKNYLEYSILDQNNNCESLMQSLDKVYKNLNIPNLSKYGFINNKMDEFVAGSMNALGGSFAGNPVEFNEDAVRQVYKNLIVE